jgi:hypothetical protein
MAKKSMFDASNLLAAMSPEARAGMEKLHAKIDETLGKFFEKTNEWKQRHHQLVMESLKALSETNGVNLLDPNAATFAQLTWSDAVSLRATDSSLQFLYNIAIDEAAMRAFRDGESPLFVRPDQIDRFISVFKPSQSEKYEPVEIFSCMIHPDAEKSRYPRGRDPMPYMSIYARPTT